MLALALFYSAIADMRNGEPAGATISILAGLAFLYVTLGWALGLIAKQRIRSGKGGSISRWAAKVWGHGGDSGKGSAI